MIFLANFSIFMIYFQLAMMGVGIGGSFQLPLFLQFIILFFYNNKYLTTHLRVLSMDKFEHEDEQQSWASSTQLKIYVVCFIYVIYMQELYFNHFLIFICFGSIWIP